MPSCWQFDQPQAVSKEKETALCLQGWRMVYAYVALGPAVCCAGSQLLHVGCLLLWCWGANCEGFFGFLLGSCFSLSAPARGEQEGSFQPPGVHPAAAEVCGRAPGQESGAGGSGGFAADPKPEAAEAQEVRA